jgi:hypothetical protein
MPARSGHPPFPAQARLNGHEYWPAKLVDIEEQERSRFQYQYSNCQIEYSRNLVFEVGGYMEQVFQALIDRSRAPLDLKTIKTILGYQRRPRYRKRKKSVGRMGSGGRETCTWTLPENEVTAGDTGMPAIFTSEVF